MKILHLSENGMPLDWISPEEATTQYATNSVAWTLGDPVKEMRGGMNSVTGEQSRIELHPIIATFGTPKVNLFDAAPSVTNEKLFRRDIYICCWCGANHGPDGKGLTREHIIPSSLGGGDNWENLASACSSCNHNRGNKLMHEVGLKLLYVPYRPTVFEEFILRSRVVTGDAHDWLRTRVAKNSRWHLAA
jgi:hypothetical protein